MSDFSANASTIGSLHQVRYALVLLLESEEASILLEGLDDIDINAPRDDPRSLLQLKHRAEGTALTNSDVDLWKTLRIWSEHTASGEVDPSETVFTLATTAIASDGSAPRMLRPGQGRDVSKALYLLNAVAAKSENKKLKAAFSAFTALPHAKRRLLLERTFVLDGSPAISEARELLEKRLAPTVRPDHRQPLADRLEGWWFRQCVDQLLDDRGAISGFELFEQASYLAESFRPTALPLDYFDLRPSDDEAASLNRRQFVAQLAALGLRPKRIENAVVDYFRAFTQRSRWASDRVLIGGELERYEAGLREEWERMRDLLHEDLDEDATEEALQEVGKALLKWAEFDADIRIRPEVSEPYVWRGSFHILADEDPPRIWWHPEFIKRLGQVVGAASQ